MLLLSVNGFIRFDVEDFLTPESDQALHDMIGAMRKRGLPGSYGIVGKKAEALYKRGRQDILDLLKEEPSLGFHSLSHSEHPTLAEEMAAYSYEDGLSRFMAREAAGVEMVTRRIKAPSYFTQPGGNWIPQALEGLPALGMDTFFTDSFNSYVIDLPHPYWYGDVLHLSFPVVNPRPFGLGLPHNRLEAVSLIDQWQSTHDSGSFMVMLHPTELVTHEFWDAVNFSGGKTATPLKPAPLRSLEEQRQALESFREYLGEIQHLPVNWQDVASLKARIQEPELVTVERSELFPAVVREGLGPMSLSRGYLSAAEALFAMCLFELNPTWSQVQVPNVKAPVHWAPAAFAPESLATDRLRAFSHQIVQSVQKDGRLPSIDLQAGLPALLGGHAPFLAFLQYVKPPQALHWDWPIFPPEFRPMALWEDARRMAWSLKRAVYE